MRKMTTNVKDNARYAKPISISAINPRKSCDIKNVTPRELSEILVYLEVFFIMLRVRNSFDAAPYRNPQKNPENINKIMKRE